MCALCVDVYIINIIHYDSNDYLHTFYLGFLPLLVEKRDLYPVPIKPFGSTLSTVNKTQNFLVFEQHQFHVKF